MTRHQIERVCVIAVLNSSEDSYLFFRLKERL